MAEVTKTLYLTKDILDDAISNALKEQSETMLSQIKANLKSMGVEESGREIDSFQAKSKNWSTPLGSRAKSEDEIDAPTGDNDVIIGSTVPYVGANEYGDGIKPPRPAVRNAAKIDDTVIKHGYNEILSKRLPK